jgi:hypothetical protein
MSGDISAGRILWVRLSPRGKGKKRLAVALGSPDNDNSVYVVVGSASCEPSDIENACELPWSFDGHCRTKLKKRTILDLDWIETVSGNDVIAIGGVLPDSVLASIQDRIRTKSLPRCEPKQT